MHIHSLTHSLTQTHTRFSFRAALAYSYAMYGVELFVLFEPSVYKLANVGLAIALVVEQVVVVGSWM